MNTEQSLKNTILGKIETGELAMKSRARFLVGTILLCCVLCAVVAVTVFLVSYTVFTLHESGRMFLLGFGWQGLYVFLLIFPWFVFLIDVLLLFILDAILRRFRLGYHTPVMFLFVGTVGVLLLGSFVINMTSLHGRLRDRAEHEKLPVVGGFYNNLRESHRDNGVFEGVILSIDGNTFMLDTQEKGMATTTRVVKVIAPIGANIPNVLSVGDQVFVGGDVVNGEIQAYGVKKF